MNIHGYIECVRLLGSRGKYLRNGKPVWWSLFLIRGTAVSARNTVTFPRISGKFHSRLLEPCMSVGFNRSRWKSVLVNTNRRGTLNSFVLRSSCKGEMEFVLSAVIMAKQSWRRKDVIVRGKSNSC